MDVIELMKKELLRRKYSIRTIKTYVYCLIKFMNKCHKEPKKINRKDIIDYLNRFIEKDFSGSSINVHLQALKFLMEEVLHRPKTFYYIKYSKMPKKLPEVLTKDETIRLMEVITNKKHQLMIKLMYSAGLRVSELVHLKVRDFEFDKNYGWVRNGKGNKDRLLIIAKSLKNELPEYVKENNLCVEDYLFSGQKQAHMSTKSVYMIVKIAAKKAEIRKEVHPHTLRHSFATHLIENGYDVNSVQSLLGHSSSETTMVYLHIASPRMIDIESPLDNLNVVDNHCKVDAENSVMENKISMLDSLREQNIKT